VDVDPATGFVTLLKHWVAHDAGTVVNPMLVAAQIRGGVAQGIGATLFEECHYDETGQLNEDKTVLTLTGQWAQKAFGGAVHKEKVVITRKSKDETLVQMFEASGEEEMHQVIELTYKRTK
jgi:xanthine dehydrogenase molybdopterin-binding subunit B